MRAMQLSQLLLFTVALAQRKCYLPNGDLAPSDKPCISTPNHVFCCPSGYSCQGAPGPACSANDTLIRPSCTDPTFASVNCPHYCIGRQFADQPDLLRCSASLGGGMCCGYDVRRGLCSCDPRNNTFSLGTYELVTRTAASTTTTSITKPKNSKTAVTAIASDSASPASDSDSSSSASSSSGLSAGAKVGIGVAVAVLVLGLAAIAALLVMRRRRRAREQNKSSDPMDQPAFAKAELDADVTARHPAERVDPKYELPASTAETQSPVELDSRMLPMEMNSHMSPTTPR